MRAPKGTRRREMWGFPLFRGRPTKGGRKGGSHKRRVKDPKHCVKVKIILWGTNQAATTMALTVDQVGGEEPLSPRQGGNGYEWNCKPAAGVSGFFKVIRKGRRIWGRREKSPVGQACCWVVKGAGEPCTSCKGPFSEKDGWCTLGRERSGAVAL